jgi:hypothetical protein
MRLFSEQINKDIRFDDTIEDVYKCDMDKNTIESVKSMIYENDTVDFSNIISCNSSDSDKYSVIYDNIIIEEDVGSITKNELDVHFVRDLQFVEEVQDIQFVDIEDVQEQDIQKEAEEDVDVENIEVVDVEVIDVVDVENIEDVQDVDVEEMHVIQDVIQNIIQDVEEAQDIEVIKEAQDIEVIKEAQDVEVKIPKKRGRPRKL